MGSFLYVALHYFLNKEVRTGIPEKLRKFYGSTLMRSDSYLNNYEISREIDQ